MYVNQRGQGMYHYLTGAASWLLLTVLNEMYGIKGQLGALKLQPKLLATQFTNGMASASARMVIINVLIIAGIIEQLSDVYFHANNSGVR